MRRWKAVVHGAAAGRARSPGGRKPLLRLHPPTPGGSKEALRADSNKEASSGRGVLSAVFPRGHHLARLSVPAAFVRGQGLTGHRSHEVWLRVWAPGACAVVLSPLSPGVLNIPAHGGSWQELGVRRAPCRAGHGAWPGEALVRPWSRAPRPATVGAKESKAGGGTLDSHES